MTSNIADFKSRLVAIENEARFLQLEVWNSGAELWGAEAPTDPLHALEPGVALRLKGFMIQTVDTLGEMNFCGRRTEIAGSIDRDRRIVCVSSRFSCQEQRFTAAHELAHAVLHPHGTSIHRDRPMDHTRWQKDPQEREADFFAACFLMPEKQVRRWFQRLFLTDRFVLNDETSFALCTKPLDVVLSHIRSHRDLSRTLATAILYNGQCFPSLAKLFRVSPTAMAYRLEEIGLVVDPHMKRRA